MGSIKAFLRGIVEFRRAFTTHYRDWRNAQAYDHGREFAHRITLRRFEA